mgnify:CR=1 FL=1
MRVAAATIIARDAPRGERSRTMRALTATIIAPDAPRSSTSLGVRRFYVV